MKFAVLSDTHYISEEMIHSDKRGEMLLKNKINKSVFESLAATDEFDTVLITGDLTHSGDEESHKEYIEMLRKVKNSGKNVYVLTATHDFQFSRSYAVKEGWNVKYKTHPWHNAWFDKDSFAYKDIVTDDFSHLPEEACKPPFKKVCTPKDLWEMYREFGRDQAFSVCETDYSYCVKLDEKIWCLMLNNNFRDIDPRENMSASYSPDCFKWIESIVNSAKEEGAFVFACTHHSLVPPVPAYKIGATDRNMRRAYVAHALADIGISLIFSGHTHFSDIGFAVSDKGKTLCNITTPAISYLPPMYRVAELEAEKKTINLTAIPVKNSDEFGIKEATLKEHFKNEFINEYCEKVSLLPAPLNKLIPALKVKHIYPLCRCAKLSKSEYDSIKDTKLFDIIMELVINMQCGDGNYTPDTPVYRFMMGFAAAADSIIASFPFIDIRKKLLGYTVSQVIEPMLFNNFIPDNNADFKFDILPEKRMPTPAFCSMAGDILMSVLSVFAIVLSPLSPIAASAVIPVLTIRKKIKNRVSPHLPERY
ncbi:MAG: metallophosphoesterase [Oscillospiraceae bacterium]|nr:metallophosphoesterase [Oscillospiraceae bacterium]